MTVGQQAAAGSSSSSPHISSRNRRKTLGKHPRAKVARAAGARGTTPRPPTPEQVTRPRVTDLRVRSRGRSRVHPRHPVHVAASSPRTQAGRGMSSPITRAMAFRKTNDDGMGHGRGAGGSDPERS